MCRQNCAAVCRCTVSTFAPVRTLPQWGVMEFFHRSSAKFALGILSVCDMMRVARNFSMTLTLLFCFEGLKDRVQMQSPRDALARYIGSCRDFTRDKFLGIWRRRQRRYALTNFAS